LQVAHGDESENSESWYLITNLGVRSLNLFGRANNPLPVPICMADGISGDGALIIKADPTKTGVPIRLLRRRAE